MGSRFPDQANGIEAVAYVCRLTTVNMHGLGWDPSILWKSV